MGVLTAKKKTVWLSEILAEKILVLFTALARGVLGGYVAQLVVHQLSLELSKLRPLKRMEATSALPNPTMLTRALVLGQIAQCIASEHGLTTLIVPPSAMVAHEPKRLQLPRLQKTMALNVPMRIIQNHQKPATQTTVPLIVLVNGRVGARAVVHAATVNTRGHSVFHNLRNMVVCNVWRQMMIARAPAPHAVVHAQ